MNTEILCTKDYDQFHFHTMQRGLDPLHVAKVQRSMKKRGFIQSSHIVVTPDMEIIDGQHRFAAAKNLSLAIFYTVESGLEVEDVRDMARTNAGWKLDDYVTSYIRQGNEDYKQLRELRIRSGLNWDAFIRSFDSTNKVVREDIIGGKFYLTDIRRQQIENFLNRFEIFKEAFPKGWFHRHFVGAAAFVFAHPKYDHAQMTARLEYQSTRLVRCANTEDYVNVLEGIYNYRSHAANVVDFEYKRRAA